MQAQFKAFFESDAFMVMLADEIGSAMTELVNKMFVIIQEVRMTKQEERIIEVIRKIVNAGNNAEVRKCKDGTWKVYKVKKSIKEVG